MKTRGIIKNAQTTTHFEVGDEVEIDGIRRFMSTNVYVIKTKGGEQLIPIEHIELIDGIPSDDNFTKEFKKFLDEQGLVSDGNVKFEAIEKVAQSFSELL